MCYCPIRTVNNLHRKGYIPGITFPLQQKGIILYNKRKTCSARKVINSILKRDIAKEHYGATER